MIWPSACPFSPQVLSNSAKGALITSKFHVELFVRQPPPLENTFNGLYEGWTHLADERMMQSVIALYQSLED